MILGIGSCWPLSWHWRNGGTGWRGAKHPFVIWTDHKNLIYIQGAKRLNPWQARWALFFNRFDFVLSYRPGSKNIKPDALSRQFESQEEEDRSEPIIPRYRVLAGIQWDLETAVRKAQIHQPDPGNGPSGRLFVPNTIRSEVLQWGHAAPSSGHPGVLRTLRRIQSKFWWPNMGTDVRRMVAACSTCARNKQPRDLPQGKLHPLPIPRRPWSHISMDFVSGLPNSAR